ncbi:MAG: hypothetical protein ABSB82_19630 [Terriglobia bacterium]
MENPFVFGEIVDQERFIDREREMRELIRDTTDGQKIFLLSPRRFGKSSLVALAFLMLRKRHIRTVILPVTSYASYSQFLEKFAARVIRAAGPWERVKDWASRFVQRVRPEISINGVTGELEISLGRAANLDPAPMAPDVFALPGELTRKGGFRMAICLDEFQGIRRFDGQSIENALRNEVQRQRGVAYVFSGSQPSLMEDMLSARRPFHKAGPKMFLDKISAHAWKDFIVGQFRRRQRSLAEPALDYLLDAADLIPYDVQRLAHELWDDAELKGKQKLGIDDVRGVIDGLVKSQAAYYERLWEQLPLRQRAILQALTRRAHGGLFAQGVREAFRLGAASSVQRALQAMENKDILDRYQGKYFLLDPLFKQWIQRKAAESA